MTIPTLLERIEKCEGPDTEIDKELVLLEIASISKEERLRRAEAALAASHAKIAVSWPPRNYTASLDASIALVERMLPGWVWGRNFDGDMYLTRSFNPGNDIHTYEGHANLGGNPPLSLLSALLRALIQKEQQ